MRKWILAALVALTTAVAVPLALFSAPTNTVAADSYVTTPNITHAVANNGRAVFYWTQNHPHLSAGYNIYRDGRYYDTVEAPRTSYLDDNATRTSHTYYVVAFAGKGEKFSNKSNSITASSGAVSTPTAATTQKPATPRIDRHSGSNSNVVLSWAHDSLSNAVGVNVYKNDAYITTIELPREYYTDTNHRPGDSYYIVAYNDAGFSGKSTRYTPGAQ